MALVVRCTVIYTGWSRNKVLRTGYRRNATCSRTLIFSHLSAAKEKVRLRFRTLVSAQIPARCTDAGTPAKILIYPKSGLLHIDALPFA